MSNTRNSVLSDIQTPRSGLKNEAQPSFFLTHFEVFGYLMKHCFECLIKLLKLIVKCGENKGIKSPKSMQIKTGYQKLIHGSDVLCVPRLELLMILRI